MRSRVRLSNKGVQSRGVRGNIFLAGVLIYVFGYFFKIRGLLRASYNLRVTVVILSSTILTAVKLSEDRHVSLVDGGVDCTLYFACIS